MPREKIVSVVLRLWNMDTMRTETYFNDSLATKHKMSYNLQVLGTVHYLWEGGMGEKMGGPEILATAKRGILGKFFVIEGGVLKF